MLIRKIIVNILLIFFSLVSTFGIILGFGSLLYHKKNYEKTNISLLYETKVPFNNTYIHFGKTFGFIYNNITHVTDVLNADCQIIDILCIGKFQNITLNKDYYFDTDNPSRIYDSLPDISAAQQMGYPVLPLWIKLLILFSGFFALFI